MTTERGTRTTYQLDMTAGGNPIIIVDGQRLTVGKLTDEQLRALKNAGKWRVKTGKKPDGYMFQMIAMYEQLRRGQELRNIKGQF